MKEVVSLVSWEDTETLGKISDSDWVCPIGSLKPLEAVHELGGTPTDEDVTIFANGRQQHLDMIRFPEGYLAARIIDSETGKILTDSNASYRYGGIFTCDCGEVHGACVTSVLSEHRLPLAGGKELSGIYNFDDGTQTIIKPVEARDEPGYIERLRTAMHITPASHSLYLRTEGDITTVDGGGLKLDIRERQGKISAEVTAWTGNGYSNTGQVNLTLDGEGQPTAVMVHKAGFLKLMGVGLEGVAFNPQNEWAQVTDPALQQKIVAGSAEVLGLEAGARFDIRRTASNLYAAMGVRVLHPASILAARTK